MLDETVSLVQAFNSAGKDDIALLIQGGWIVEKQLKNGMICYEAGEKKEEPYTGKLKNIVNCARNNYLFMVADKFMVFVVPPEKMSLFEDVCERFGWTSENFDISRVIWLINNHLKLHTQIRDSRKAKRNIQ